ncbi:hypothetical protein HRbin14_02241 [bacterium HR14]|nr:hypothetical protein HRbin14_02241 [bacterium HR14]
MRHPDGDSQGALGVGARLKANRIERPTLHLQIRLVKLHMPVLIARLRNADLHRAFLIDRLCTGAPVLFQYPLGAAPRKIGVAQQRGSQRLVYLAPCLSKAGSCAIATAEPLVPLALQRLLEQFGHAVIHAQKPALQASVLVVDFHHRQGGVFSIGQPCVGVPMGQ